MRLSTGVAVVLLLATPAFAQRASISGVVIKAGSGEPAAGATVKIVPEPPSSAPAGFQAQTTTTGADGSFRFDDIESRPWWIVANLQGYLPSEYGQRSPTGTGLPLNVVTGERGVARLTIWPTSGISGRVVDGDGDPLGRVQVLALRTVYREGRPSMTIVQTVMTNDRGEYRMFWLQPGTYRVAARQWDGESNAAAVNIGPPRRFSTNEQGTSPVIARRAGANGSAIEETFIPIYAPSTPDPQLATPVDLGAGDNAGGIDIQMIGDRVPARHVRGVFVRSQEDANSRPGFFPQLLMVPRTDTPFAVVAPALARADGSFDIAGVAPGSYYLYMQDSTAIMPIEVGDADVDNVTLVQAPRIILNGHLTIDRGGLAELPNERISAADFQIQMTRDPYLVGAPDGGPRFNPAPQPDGRIGMNGVAPGDYRIAVRPFGFSPDGENLSGRRISPPLINAYVKSLKLGETDALVDGLRLSGPTSQQLDIVVSLNGGEVAGTVTDGRSPSPNVVVVAVPDGTNRGRRDLYQRRVSDAQGKFTMNGLAPGDYTFYAWDDVERGAWESPEFIRAFEGRGRFVRVHEGRNDSIELSVIVGR